jgi:hypothetical protein
MPLGLIMAFVAGRLMINGCDNGSCRSIGLVRSAGYALEEAAKAPVWKNLWKAGGFESIAGCPHLACIGEGRSGLSAIAEPGPEAKPFNIFVETPAGLAVALDDPRETNEKERLGRIARFT